MVKLKKEDIEYLEGQIEGLLNEIKTSNPYGSSLSYLKEKVNKITNTIDEYIEIIYDDNEVYLITDCMFVDKNLRVETIDKDKLRKERKLSEDEFEDEFIEIIEEELDINTYENYCRIPKTKYNINKVKDLLKSLQ